MVVASSLGRSFGPATFCTTTYSQGEFDMVAWDYCWEWGLVKRSPFLSEGLFQTDLFFLFVKNKYNCCGCHVVTQVWIVRVLILERVPEAITWLFAKIQPQLRTSSSCVLYIFRLSILYVLHLKVDFDRLTVLTHLNTEVAKDCKHVPSDVWLLWILYLCCALLVCLTEKELRGCWEWGAIEQLDAQTRPLVQTSFVRNQRFLNFKINAPQRQMKYVLMFAVVSFI